MRGRRNSVTIAVDPALAAGSAPTPICCSKMPTTSVGGMATEPTPIAAIATPPRSSAPAVKSVRTRIVERTLREDDLWVDRTDQRGERFCETRTGRGN